MRIGWLARLAGLCAGVALAILLVGEARLSQPPLPPTGAIISECDGAIRRIAIQYVGGMDFVWLTYRAFFASLPSDVRVELICPGEADRDELLANIGQPAGRFEVIFTCHAMTTWSRDRWLTLAPAKDGEPITLVAPREESAAGAWPARAGDEQLAFDLAANRPGVVARRNRLAFDGGDFLSDDRTVFVSPAVLERNLHTAVESEGELLKELQPLVGKKTLVPLHNAPPHHLGMFVAIAGDGQAIVGDPSLGRSLRQPSETIDPDDSAATQQQFDDIAAQVAAAGYHVRRIPTVVAPDGKIYLTYVNGLIDQRAGQRTVYLPVYRDQAALNTAAEQVWRDLGYTVVPIDCTVVFPHFGTLHCLVNVLRRS